MLPTPIGRVRCSLLFYLEQIPVEAILNSILLFWFACLKFHKDKDQVFFYYSNNSYIVLIMEKAMAPHSRTLAWKISWMEEPGRLQSMGSLRVGHDWATSLSLFTFMHWRREWQPTPVFLPGESQGRGAWWAAVYGVTQSRTLLNWLRISTATFTFR